MEKVIDVNNFVCRFYYASGRCSFGSKCFFPHVIGGNRIPDNFCRHNFAGKCHFKNSCHNEHATIYNHCGRKLLRICPREKSDNRPESHQFAEQKLVESDENLAGAAGSTAAKEQGSEKPEDRSPFKGENFSFFTDHCKPCCTPSNRCQGDFTTRSSNPPPTSDNQDYNRNMRYHTSPFTLGFDTSLLDLFKKDNQDS